MFIHCYATFLSEWCGARKVINIKSTPSIQAHHHNRHITSHHHTIKNGGGGGGGGGLVLGSGPRRIEAVTTDGY